MLYTIGKTEGYKKYMKDCLEKSIKPEKRKGGTVWRHIEDILDYLREISNGNEYTIYGVIAEWIIDTKLPEWNGDPSEIKDIKYHELLRDAEIVKLMKPIGLLTRELPSFNCKGDVIVNGNKEKTYTADKLEIEDTGQPFFDLVKDRILDCIVEYILFEPLIVNNEISETSLIFLESKLKEVLLHSVKERFGTLEFGTIPEISLLPIDSEKGKFQVVFRRLEDNTIINNNIEFNDYLLTGFEEVKGAKFIINLQKIQK